MVNVRIEDQKDKDGKVIGQYATFEKVTKRETTTLSKQEVERAIIKLEAELLEWKEVLSKFTI